MKLLCLRARGGLISQVVNDFPSLRVKKIQRRNYYKRRSDAMSYQESATPANIKRRNQYQSVYRRSKVIVVPRDLTRSI